MMRWLLTVLLLVTFAFPAGATKGPRWCTFSQIDYRIVSTAGWSTSAGSISFRYVPTEGLLTSGMPNRILIDGRVGGGAVTLLYVWWNGDVTTCASGNCTTTANPGWTAGSNYDFVFQWNPGSNIIVSRNGSQLVNASLGAPAWGTIVHIGADLNGANPARGTISNLVTP